MAVHVVGFKDIIRYEDGDIPILKGRELLDEFYDTKQYKSLKPGDEIEETGHRSRVINFVEAKPFIASLEVSNDHHFGVSSIALNDVENRVFYPMFLADFVSMSTRTVVDHGKITGRFGYVKRNKNFGIEFLGETGNI